MVLNASKTKELLISFAKSPPSVDGIIVSNSQVERVDHCTLLGLEISNNVTWELHCQKILKEANSHLFFLKQLKRAKVSAKDIVATFLAVVRPVLEYDCQVWHPGLTEEQHDALEHIQERVMKIVCPTMTYMHACMPSTTLVFQSLESTGQIYALGCSVTCKINPICSITYCLHPDRKFITPGTP